MATRVQEDSALKNAHLNSKIILTTVKSQRATGVVAARFSTLRAQKSMDLCTTISASKDTNHGDAAIVKMNVLKACKI